MIQTDEQAGILRYGTVSEYDPARHMARVNFPDLGLTSYWLPVLLSNSLNTHFEAPLDPGEHVACLMAGTGTESGVILGAFHDDKNKPLLADKDTHAITFEDGSRVFYDRKNHVLSIDSTGNVQVRAQNITLTGGNILLDGGSISLDGSVTCPGYCRC